MNHKEKIESLNNENKFDMTNKKQRNTETFITQDKSRNLMKLAYEKKKEADAIVKEDRKKGFDIYLDSIYGYIKGYLMFEKEFSTEKMVSEWKTLDKYITSLIDSLKEDENEYRNIYEYIMFNVRFHYLFYQGFYVVNKDSNEGKECLKGFLTLKGICERSMVDNFCVMRLEKIEEYVREKLKMVTVNK
ncbi:hypothetical protein BDAP_001409 [Binucleata daphniae]